MRTKLIGVLGAAVMIAGFVGSPAAHADVTVHVGAGSFIIDEGTLTDGSALIGGAGNQFADVTLNGTTQLTSAPITPFTVIDARGTAKGWTLTLVVPQFNNGGATHSIPAAGVSMDAPQVSATDTQVLTNFTELGSTTGFAAPGIAIVTSTTDVNSMGTFTVSPEPLRLTIPYDTYADDYTSLATLTLATQ